MTKEVSMKQEVYFDFYPEIWDNLENLETSIKNLKRELTSDSTYNSHRAAQSILRNYEIICNNFENLSSSIHHLEDEFYLKVLITKLPGLLPRKS